MCLRRRGQQRCQGKRKKMSRRQRCVEGGEDCAECWMTRKVRRKRSIGSVPSGKPMLESRISVSVSDQRS